MRPFLMPALTAALAVALLAGCERQPSPQPEAAAPPRAQEAAAAEPSAGDAAWQPAVDGFVEQYFEFFPVFAANAGKHEFDGRLPDFSPVSMQATIGWLHAQRDSIAAFGDAGPGKPGLDKTQRFQRDYVLSVIDAQLFWLEESGFAHTNPVLYTGDLSPSMYLTRDYAPLPQRMAAFVRYQEALPTAIEQIRANLQPPLAATYVELGANTFRGYADFFRDSVPAIFAKVDDAALQARFRASNAAAAKAARDMADWFAAQKPAATQDFALGAEKFSRMLSATERVDIPLDRLNSIGEADLARNLASLRSACERFAAGQSLQACLDKANADKPEGGAVEGARRQLAGLRQFILDTDLVSIPGTEQAQVAEAPPFNRWNFAYIEIPGPYEKDLPSVYYIAPPDPAWLKAEQDAYVPGKSDLLFTSAHKSGLGISCSSCIPIAPTGSSASCSSATPSPRAGRTMSRR